MANSGLFVVFEGIGGAGKSMTLLSMAAALSKQKYPVLITRQPGGTNVGQEIRNIALNPEHRDTLDSTAQLFLYAADRYLNIQQVILPALAADKIVLCDRYDHSTYAYQAAGGGDPEALRQVNALATKNLRPHRTYWFDVDPITARKRVHDAKRTEPDRFDQEAIEFAERLRRSYQQQAKEYPAEIMRIDANQPLADVVEQTRTDLLTLARKHYQQ